MADRNFGDSQTCGDVFRVSASSLDIVQWLCIYILRIHARGPLAISKPRTSVPYSRDGAC